MLLASISLHSRHIARMKRRKGCYRRKSVPLVAKTMNSIVFAQMLSRGQLIRLNLRTCALTAFMRLYCERYSNFTRLPNHQYLVTAGGLFNNLALFYSVGYLIPLHVPFRYCFFHSDTNTDPERKKVYLILSKSPYKTTGLRSSSIRFNFEMPEGKPSIHGFCLSSLSL